HISGCHLNPAVTVGLFAAGRVPAAEVVPYVVAQVLGGIGGAAVLAVIASGQADFNLVASGFAANGFCEHSPGGYGLWASLSSEVVMTFFFLIISLGTTDLRAPTGFAPMAIEHELTMINLFRIPVNNSEVNPALSTSQTLFVEGCEL